MYVCVYIIIYICCVYIYICCVYIYIYRAKAGPGVPRKPIAFYLYGYGKC